MQYRVAARAAPEIQTPWERMVSPWGIEAAARLRARAGADVWRVLESIEVDEQTRGWFEQARREGSRWVLPEDVIFSAPFLPARVVIDPEVGLDIDEPDELAMLQEVLSGGWQAHGPGHPGFDLAEQLIELGFLVAPETERLPHFDRPGIHRLQHASLLLRSREAAVLTDPVYYLGRRPCAWNRPAALPPIDAILLTHSHRDHFSILSLMQFPRDTLIVLPPARPSILCEDMTGQLRAAGFTRVAEAPWHSTLEVKDIRISVYPFYGEQPWVGFADPTGGLRNWGSTFVVEVHGKKAWLLVDSGPEAGHPVAELCAQVAREHGHIDFVMSNLREFHWFPGQIDGSGAFLFCFPIEQLLRTAEWPYDRLVTYGPGGLRELLGVLRPSHFLPYAHWFHPLERAPHFFEDTGRTERGLTQAILDPQVALATEVMSWQVGDHLGWEAGRIEIASPLQDG